MSKISVHRKILQRSGLELREYSDIHISILILAWASTLLLILEENARESEENRQAKPGSMLCVYYYSYR